MPATSISIAGKAELGHFAYTANSGKTVTRFFCRTCGVNLYSDGEGAPGIKFVRAGALDDEAALEGCRPDVEVFVKRRAAWVQGVQGCAHKEEM